MGAWMDGREDVVGWRGAATRGHRTSVHPPQGEGGGKEGSGEMVKWGDQNQSLSTEVKLAIVGLVPEVF